VISSIAVMAAVGVVMVVLVEEPIVSRSGGGVSLRSAKLALTPHTVQASKRAKKKKRKKKRNK
jgi:hypothetical protein